MPPAGGSLAGDVGIDVSVVFPEGVWDEPLAVTLEQVTQPPTTGGFALLGRVFSITARDEDENPVTHFNGAFSIVIAYAEEELGSLAEEELVLHYWEEDAGEWVAIEGVVDTAANTVTVTLDHLTVFALMQTGDRRLYLPRLHR